MNIGPQQALTCTIYKVPVLHIDATLQFQSLQPRDSFPIPGVIAYISFLWQDLYL